jgi:hypothetical protein
VKLQLCFKCRSFKGRFARRRLPSFDRHSNYRQRRDKNCALAYAQRPISSRILVSACGDGAAAWPIVVMGIFRALRSRYVRQRTEFVHGKGNTDGVVKARGNAMLWRD